MPDRLEVGFIDDEQILDRLPQPSQLGRGRVGGFDLNRPRMRSALHATQALCLRPGGFTVAEFAAQVRRLTGQVPGDHSLRQDSYDLRKMRAQGLVLKPERCRCYQVPGTAARTISALLTLRDQVVVARPGFHHLGRHPLREPAHRDAGAIRRPRHSQRGLDNFFAISLR